VSAKLNRTRAPCAQSSRREHFISAGAPSMTIRDYAAKIGMNEYTP